MDFISEIAKICAGVEQEEGKRIREAASVCAATIAAGRGVFLFGAGHSALPCQEAFPRIGSVVGFIQLTEPALSYNGHVIGKGGQRQMSFWEGTSGLAEVILANYQLQPRDTLIVISNSGINALPVELCHLANRQGLTTIGLTSREHSLANQPRNPLGKRLLDLADIVIDNHTPEGDALIDLGVGERLGGSSTIIHMVIVNALIVETGARLREGGFPLQVYPSHNVSGDREGVLEKEEHVFEAYRKLMAQY